MVGLKCFSLGVLLAAGLLYQRPAMLASMAAETAGQPTIVQAQVVLTVSESKRLIARAVAQMPIVKKALKDGMVIIAKGTTNTYVAEEILGKKIPHGAYVLGWTRPEKGGKRFRDVKSIDELVLVKGRVQDDLSLADAVRKLGRGDVVIKGANALDYGSKLAAVIVGSSDAGTTGKILPYVGARKAHLVIPVGLEKQLAGSAVDIVKAMREPLESLNSVPTMFLLTGQIVTELEALEALAQVSPLQVGAGGVGGAEGAVRILCRGSRKEVQQALELAEQIQGEPPFIE